MTTINSYGSRDSDAVRWHEYLQRALMVTFSDDFERYHAGLVALESDQPVLFEAVDSHARDTLPPQLFDALHEIMVILHEVMVQSGRRFRRVDRALYFYCWMQVEDRFAFWGSMSPSELWMNTEWLPKCTFSGILQGFVASRLWGLLPPNSENGLERLAAHSAFTLAECIAEALIDD